MSVYTQKRNKFNETLRIQQDEDHLQSRVRFCTITPRFDDDDDDDCYTTFPSVLASFALYTIPTILSSTWLRIQ
jgi:hypothetical protein